MKDKKYKVKEHLDGSKTYTPTSGVGFYNPFILLKKDFSIQPELIHDSIRNGLFTLQLLQTISSDNRVSTIQLSKIGEQLSLSKMTVSRLIKHLTEATILIKMTHGLYKVNEDLVIFKQDHEGYMALKKETQSLTQNITNNITQNIIVQDGQSLKDILIQDYQKRLSDL